MKSKTQELLFAQPQQVPEIQREIQKLRIAAGIFREIELQISDPNLYKEMNLLNRMMVGKDLESEADKQKSTVEQENASAKLRDSYGLSRESANRIARIVSIAASGGMDLPQDDEEDDGTGPEPLPIDPTRLQ